MFKHLRPYAAGLVVGREYSMSRATAAKPLPIPSWGYLWTNYIWITATDQTALMDIAPRKVGVISGILCGNCNWVVGNVKESTERCD